MKNYFWFFFTGSFISEEKICKTIRKKSKVPIIMLTAKIEEDILNNLDIGTDDYVTKTIQPKTIDSKDC